jgi:predicted DNA-binding ribbon-helix-helix protein
MLLEKTPTTAGIVIFVSIYIFYSSMLLEKTPTTAGNCCISVSLFVRVVGENSNNGGNIRQFIRPCCWRKLQQRQEKMFYKYIILF